MSSCLINYILEVTGKPAGAFTHNKGYVLKAEETIRIL